MSEWKLLNDSMPVEVNISCVYTSLNVKFALVTVYLSLDSFTTVKYSFRVKRSTMNFVFPANVKWL